MRIRATSIVVWAYMAEAVAAFFLCVFTDVLFGSSGFFEKFQATSKEWGVVAGLLTAGSLGGFWAYFNQTRGPFAAWLHWKQADRTYTAAFAYPVFVHLVTLCLLIILPSFPSPTFSRIGYGFGLYAILCVLTQIVNAAGFMKLRNAFEQEWLHQPKGN